LVCCTLGAELGGGDIAIDERDGRAIRQAMVGRFACLGAPLLGVLANDLDGGLERLDVDRTHALWIADAFAQIECGGDGRLAVVFRGPELDGGLRQHPVARGRAPELLQADWSGDLLAEAHVALEEWGWAGEAFPGQKRSEDPVARGVRKRASLPH
jgi:hypothetical protein